MFLTLCISLYTSRIVLDQLGVVDFGIYSVVGSLSLFFIFMNYGIATSIQRYLSYAIGINDSKELQRCFSSGLMAVILIGIIVLILGESVGPPMIKYMIDIPPARVSDAYFVFQFTLVSLVITVITGCFEASILSFERMAFFAYLAIAEALMKLALAISLPIIPGDKLRIYAILLTIISSVILICHIAYCRYNFRGIKITLRNSRARLRSIFSFAGWNTLSSFADLCHLQGSNLILNSFFGVTLNAAMGITNQVKHTVCNFSRSIQVAANPNIVKTYARGDIHEYSNLVYLISKISFLLLLLIGIPILLNIETILSLWLTVIPPYTVILVRLMIVFCLLDNLVGPLWIAMQATGKIKIYQIIISATWLLSLPVMYLALRTGYGPQTILVTQIGFSTVTLAIRLVFADRCCHLPFKDYICNVLLPIFKVSLLIFTLVYGASHWLDGIEALILSTLLSIVVTPTATYYVGISTFERQRINHFLHEKITFLKKNRALQQ